jgi:hypothetical protein
MWANVIFLRESVDKSDPSGTRCDSGIQYWALDGGNANGERAINPQAPIYFPQHGDLLGHCCLSMGIDVLPIRSKGICDDLISKSRPVLPVSS